MYGRGKELLVARQRGDYRLPMKATSIFVEESPDGADVWASAGTIDEANVCLAIVSVGHVFVNWEKPA